MVLMMQDDADLKRFITTKLEQMKARRALVDQRWIKCCQFVSHRTSDIDGRVPERPLFSGIPKDALAVTQRGFAGYLLSPNLRWFRYRTKGRRFEKSDTLYGANDWLEEVEDIQYTIYSNSRFYATSYEAIEDVLTIGTSYEMVTDDMENGRIVYDCYSPFECYIAEDGQRRVDTFFREYTLTADEAYSKWGDELPSEIVQKVKGNQGSVRCSFVHAIFPRHYAEVADVRIPASGSKPYASVHYCVSVSKVFRTSGYDDFPLAVHRFHLVPGSPYGESLVSKNLELVMENDNIHRKYSTAVAKQVDPPMIVPPSLQGRANLNAGAILYADVNSDGKPISVQTSIDITALAKEKADSDQMVYRVFFADLFNILMRQERERTAYEVSELKGESLILLSQLIGNMQEEKLNPLILRTLAIMVRNGLVPEAPDELKEAWREGRVNVELEGPLIQTMKQYHQTSGLTQGLSWMSSWAQIFPQSIVNVDGDEGMRQGLTSYGFPQSIIREQADVRKIKEQQAMAERQAQMQQNALAQSQVYRNMGVDAEDIAVLQQGNENMRNGGV